MIPLWRLRRRRRIVDQQWWMLHGKQNDSFWAGPPLYKIHTNKCFFFSSFVYKNELPVLQNLLWKMQRQIGWYSPAIAEEQRQLLNGFISSKVNRLPTFHHRLLILVYDWSSQDSWIWTRSRKKSKIDAPAQCWFVKFCGGVSIEYSYLKLPQSPNLTYRLLTPSSWT